MRGPMPDRIKIPAALWEGLKRAGLRQIDVVRRANVPLAVLKCDAPVTTKQFFCVWRAIEEVGADPAIGLRIAAGLDGAVMPLSFIAAYHAQDFRDALGRVARFKRLCAPEEVSIEEEADRSSIVVAWPYSEGEEVPGALVDATMASLIELGRRGTATPLVPLKVELAHPERSRALYESYFRSPVRFRAKQDRLTFRREDLDKPFANYNQELLELLTPELNRRLDQELHAGSVAEQIKWVLRRRLTAGRPDIRSVATELATSARSLQRRLTDEGLSFQALLSETRHQLALEYLANLSLAIMEVAFMLGYEDQNSFFRAFRQWEGQTPSAWRERNTPAASRAA
jgi:AraC-like DNA-binding protein